MLERAVELRAQALALWRGPPLADVVLEGSERHTLARLSELRLATQIERIEPELKLGADAKPVAELESLATANPYPERVHAQLMLALYRSGRQADALHVYQTIRRTGRTFARTRISRDYRITALARSGTICGQPTRRAGRCFAFA